MQASPARRVADPLAASLASYAGALGFGITADAIAPWLALIPVLFLEIGSAFALVLWRATTGAQPNAPAMAARESVSAVSPSAALDTPEITKRPSAAKPESAAGISPGNPAKQVYRKRGPRRSHSRMAVLDKLKAAAPGGELVGSQAEIARALGTSVSTVHRELHRLAKEGAIRLVTTGQRTSVCLL